MIFMDIGRPPRRHVAQRRAVQGSSLEYGHALDARPPHGKGGGGGMEGGAAAIHESARDWQRPVSA